MSLPLHDLGSVKISETAHSYLSARALQKNITVVAMVRELVEGCVTSELHTFNVADETHKSKQMGGILGDMQ
jgi:tRNA A22 N-methylase